MSGLLVLAATPIGDVRDAAPRLSAEFEAADVVAAEDTRRVRRLIKDLGVTVRGTVVSCFDANELARSGELVEAMNAGQRVLLVTDAGMPSVSDPGYRVVRATVDAGLQVTVVPGPSAVLAALAVSGLPSDRFCFEGFLPRKAGERRTRLRTLAHEPRTMVFFEAPHRLGASLSAMSEIFGPTRPAVVCRELTKTYEEVLRAPLEELSEWARGGVRGEITVVVAGAPGGPTQEVSSADLAHEVRGLMEAGLDRKEAMAEVAATHRIGRREVYDALVATKSGSGDS